jgi:hypothetical protein
MKVIVRPYESADLEGSIAKLRTLAYPEWPEAHDVDWHASVYRWIESNPLADEMHRWVLDADGEVVGHLAAVPQYYRVNGQRVLAHTPTDYMVLPGYGFHALSLMRTFFRTCENYVACNWVQEATAIEAKFGAEDSGELQYELKVLDMTKYPGFPTGPPALAMKLLSRGLRAIDGALGAAFGGDLKAEEVRGFDASFDELFERIAAVVPCVPEKDAAFLRWRYGPGSFQAPVTVLGVRGVEGLLLGYAVLRVPPKHDGYLLDLMTLPGRGEVARALLREAIVRFWRAGVYVIRYRFVASPTAPSFGDLRRLGFFRRDNRRYTLPVFRTGRHHTLLVKFADRRLHETAHDIANWSYSMGDGEASFWVQ